MELPHHLIRSIENTHVAFEGLSHPLRVVNVDAEAASSEGPPAAVITVETSHNGEPRRASCAITPIVMEDEREVVTRLAECMRTVLCGEPGAAAESH
jgi:hypothetical protein